MEIAAEVSILDAAARESLARAHSTLEAAKARVEAGLDALVQTSVQRATERLVRRLEREVQNVERLELEESVAKARVIDAVQSWMEVSRVLNETWRILESFDRQPPEIRRKVFGWWIDSVLILPGPEAFVATRVQATFPTLLVAGLAKASPAELWEIEDAAERAVPKVDLSLNKPR